MLTLPRLARAAVLLLATAFAMPAVAEPADLVRTAAPAPGRTIDNTAWDRLLKTYVRTGADGLNRVDYKAFKAGGQAALKSYVASLQSVDPSALDRNGQIAFFANLYNAKTIDIVLDYYPVASIKDISLGGGLFAIVSGGPWKAKVLQVKGEQLSLDDIEHVILRPVFKESRIHYALNCASVGCPSLQTAAFTGARLDADLDAAARAYINSPRGVRIDNGKLFVSSIYHWFDADFGGTDAGVIKHLRSYAAPPLAAALRSISSVSGHAYDWALNDTAR